MSLVNPGAGEVADRFTVVTLKILFGEAAGKPVDHFRNERVVLLTKLNAREIGPWLGQLVELGAVNAALWHAEDDLRGWRLDYEAVGFDRRFSDAEVVNLAFRIQELNDHRARLIGAINKAAGDDQGEEKL